MQTDGRMTAQGAPAGTYHAPECGGDAGNGPAGPSTWIFPLHFVRMAVPGMPDDEACAELARMANALPAMGGKPSLVRVTLTCDPHRLDAELGLCVMPGGVAPLTGQQVKFATWKVVLP
jgi:hypothetical protein